MEDSFWSFLENISETPGPLIYSVLFLSSCIEYVFPPFPGDTVTLFAGFLVGAKEGWNFASVFIVINGGALAGALLDYGFGYWLGAPGRKWKTWGPRWEKMARGMDRIARGFEKHGVLYLIINRFLPSLRALFFVAAGLARVPLWKVMTFGLLSSILWNILILVVGQQVGYEKDRLLQFFRSYSVVLWCILGVVAIFLAVRWWRRRKTGGGETESSDDGSSSDSMAS